MPEIEERQARIEGVLEQIDKRLDHLESDINVLSNEISSLRKEMNSFRSEITGQMQDLRNEVHMEIGELGTKIDTNFRWLVGITVTMWVTMILTIIFKS